MSIGLAVVEKNEVMAGWKRLRLEVGSLGLGVVAMEEGMVDEVDRGIRGIVDKVG